MFCCELDLRRTFTADVVTVVERRFLPEVVELTLVRLFCAEVMISGDTGEAFFLCLGDAGERGGLFFAELVVVVAAAFLFFDGVLLCGVGTLVDKLLFLSSLDDDAGVVGLIFVLISMLTRRLLCDVVLLPRFFESPLRLLSSLLELLTNSFRFVV